MKNLTVITGCDSGIGESLCRLLHNDGRDVAISYLENNPFQGEPKIFSQRLDLCKEDEIVSFASFLKELSGEYRIDCLVNNAGIAMGGPIENIPIDIIRRVFEVNFFGLISLMQKLLPELIKSKGRIMNIGSMAGRISMPFLSPYVASKFALRGFTHSLRRELLPYGIKTVLIEPAAIATPIWNKAKEQDMSFIDEKYSKSSGEFLGKFVNSGNYGMEVGEAAKKIFSILDKKNPKTHYIIAKKRFSAYLPTIFPDRYIDKKVLKAFSMDYGKSSE